MSDVSMIFTSEIDVVSTACLASDDMVVMAARVSTQGVSNNELTRGSELGGLINFLVKNRHGSPFEHNLFVFRVTAPIFMWSEHMRHRIGFSYNEESGRYKQLDPVFYIPAEDRNVVQTGKAGQYVFVPGNEFQQRIVRESIQVANTIAYDEYEVMLEHGIAREVARMVLPVNIFSTAYVTMNARSLMNFLSLRTKDANSTFPSFPQREIEIVAEQYEAVFKAAMPLTHKAFCDNGRVAP